MKTSNKKKNERRKFFNSEKPHCSKCGSALVKVENLLGQVIGNACPLNHK